MKTKILVHFHICISVPLMKEFFSCKNKICNFNELSKFLSETFVTLRLTCCFRLLIDGFQCLHMFSSRTNNFDIIIKLSGQKRCRALGEEDVFLQNSLPRNVIRKTFCRQHNKVTKEVLVFLSYFLCVSFFLIPVKFSH